MILKHLLSTTSLHTLGGVVAIPMEYVEFNWILPELKQTWKVSR